MKKVFIALLSAVVLTVAAAFCGCDILPEKEPGNGNHDVIVVPVEVTAVQLSQEEADFVLGEGESAEITLIASVQPANAADKTVLWSCDNGDVASVLNGAVKVFGIGTAKITATAGNGISATCVITATAKKAEPTDVAVTGVKLSAASVTLEVNEIFTLGVTVEPANATNQKIIWSSSAPSVATVSGGKVKALGAGTATITATAANGVKATCAVTVNQPKPVIKEVTDIVLSATSLKLNVGDKANLGVSIEPADASDKNVTIVSSAPSVATVSGGKVTAVGVGTATITATASNGIKATCTVTVSEPQPTEIAVTNVTLSSKLLSLKVGENSTLTAAVEPTDATNKDITWSTSAPSVATVSGGKVTAVGAGTATITATASNGVKATCTVTVSEPQPVEVPVSKVTLTASALNMEAGENTTLGVTVEPATATNKNITWSTNAPSVATVSGGKVTAVGAGTATITATASNGVKATCTVTVTASRPQPEEYTVTFKSDGATVGQVTVVSGSTVSAPQNVEKSGYELVGWTTAATPQTLYNFSSPVTQSFELHAKWEKVTVSGESIITVKKYGEEYAAFEWADKNPANAKVYYKLSTASEFTQVDAQLVRAKDSTTACVDILGLNSALKYDFKVQNSEGKSETLTARSVSAYDRSGYAHHNYTSGVGAYKDDGTLKSNAVVVYVTEKTKNTVTAKIGGKTYTGIVSILQNAGTSTPLNVRIIGTVGAATWKQGNVTYKKTSSNTDKDNNLLPEAIVGMGGKALDKKTWKQAELISAGHNVLDTSVYAELKGLNSQAKWDSGKNEFDSCWNDCSVQNVKNVTLEGVGTDARIFQWGITWKNCNSIEVRNLTFEDYTEDACSIEGGKTSASSVSDFTNKNFWIHNNVFEQGINYWDVCKEQDKHEGDGATDFKGIANVTVAYNVYHDNHKTGLVGGSNSQTTANLTFHHNYYNHCSSRLPLARQANMHMYNNYYYNTTGTNMSLRAGAYAFIENCYFENANNPVVIESRDKTYGIGAAKVLGCVFSGKQPAKNEYFQVVTDRTATVKSECKFGKSFDTDSSAFYYEGGKSKVTLMLTAEEVKKQVPTLAGVHK